MHEPEECVKFSERDKTKNVHYLD